jgi:alginate O-acetyltransferase complex protein AlgJ
MTRRFLQRLPIFACAGFVAFLFLANIWNFAVERDWPKLRIRSASPLAGVARPKPATWTLDAFLSGETQKEVSNNFGRALPVFPISVRAKNQLIYSLFGESAAPGVAVGRNGQLFEQIYIDEFCKRGGAPDEPRIAQWAEAIREIQQGVEAAGKSFVYLISPSKAARYAEDLPASAPCASRATAMPDKLGPFLAALTKNGVRFVDGAGLITARRRDYEVPLFPAGGTHWNGLGAALAFREMTMIAPSTMGRLDFTWSPAPEAVGWDRDVTDLLNLLWPDVSYPTVVVTRAGAPQACKATPRLLAMGGSFLHHILVSTTYAACPPRIDYWFYMRTENNGVELGHYRRAPGEVSNGARVASDLTVLAENLREAEIVVLEENEANLGTTEQVGHLLATVRALR